MAKMSDKGRIEPNFAPHSHFHSAGEEPPHDREDKMIAVTTSKQMRDKAKEDAERKKRAGFHLDAEGQNPAGFHLGDASDSASTKDSQDDDLNLKGRGWIRCSDGTWIKDNGGSIYIKGHPPTAAQIQHVLAIANERNWGKLAVWKPGCRAIDERTSAIFQAQGRPCCQSRREAGSFIKDCQLGMDLWREKVIHDRALQKAEETLVKAKEKTPPMQPA
jgi:hypothetical protein